VLSVTYTGEITDKDRQLVDDFRIESKLSYEHHLKTLEEFGWTEECYQRGSKR
jgi:hypothetical protein